MREHLGLPRRRQSASQTPNITAACGSGEEPSKQREPHEVELTARLQARDEAAFRELIERYAARIYRVSYGILRDHNAVDEVAQQVFVKVYFSIQSFENRGSLYAWIYRIAVNECYRFRSKERLPLVCPGDSPLDATTRHTKVFKLLADIPENDRWLLISKEVEGFSLAELSQITGLNEDTIKGRLFRVRQGLLAAAARLRSRDRLTAVLSTIWRWVQRYVPELNRRCRPELRKTNGSWRCDETYLRIAGKWTYLYRAVDSTGATIEFLLSARRDGPIKRTLA